MATPIGITLQRSILYTLASFGRHYFPTLPNLCICTGFQIHTLSTYVGGANAIKIEFVVIVQILFMIKMLRQAMQIQNLIKYYLCEGLSSITKKGEIESPSLVLDN